MGDKKGQEGQWAGETAQRLLATPGTSYALRKLKVLMPARPSLKPSAVTQTSGKKSCLVAAGARTSKTESVTPASPFSRLFSLSVPPIDGTYQSGFQGKPGRCSSP